MTKQKYALKGHEHNGICVVILIVFLFLFGLTIWSMSRVANLRDKIENFPTEVCFEEQVKENVCSELVPYKDPNDCECTGGYIGDVYVEDFSCYCNAVARLKCLNMTEQEVTKEVCYPLK